MNNLESLLIFLIIGLIAGWLAGVLVKGRGFGVLGDIVVGVIGAQLGGWIFSRLDLSAYGFGGAVLMAFVGAVVLLTIIKVLLNAGSGRALSAIFLLMACSWPVQAATTVTVDSNEQVVVTQPVAYVQTVATPVVITQPAVFGDFEGRIVKIDYSRNLILVHDITGPDREVLIQQELINTHRVGDYVLVHPTTEITAITLAENPREFEGEIIRVSIPDNQILVLDTNGRERRVDMKQGMIGTYKVDDYVRVYLMADMKEAKTIETIRNVRNVEGNIVRIDSTQSRIVVLGADGKDSTVIVRQGQISNYKVGDNVRVYLLENQEQVQVIRIIR